MLGEGAQGTVFLVERLPDRKKFVAKVIFQESYFEMAEMEAKRLQSFDHENIVRCVESFIHETSENDHFIIILEHCNCKLLYVNLYSGDPLVLH